jgi:hypothetical protein
MAKKSAARMQPAKKADLPPIEEVFAEARDMFAMTVDTQAKTAKRIDNLMNIRDFVLKYYNWEVPESMDIILYCKNLQQMTVELYEDIADEVRSWTLEQFSGETMDDLLGKFIHPVDEIDDDGDMIVAALDFLSVKPYGEKMLQLHQLIQDEIAKRG